MLCWRFNFPDIPSFLLNKLHFFRISDIVDEVQMLEFPLRSSLRLFLLDDFGDDFFDDFSYRTNTHALVLGDPIRIELSFALATSDSVVSGWSLAELHLSS